ncbi:centrosomal protein of 170 kDa-like isoform X2 [Limulus polyphemus]|uniref:Centrosomal protein of 170 kDa-like isoform X2 n=1 Tax=Limulus polyphemus TaxID=6850 RepID=A0ABM1TDN6_LIMPO|nr:centrosomal protein of 170 kDa-like isoform X2 [Limulus polyphemus]
MCRSLREVLIPMGSPCKADNWILLGKGGASYHLPQSMIFIGRQECDILLQSSSVDKRHAVICYDASERCFCIKDLNSLNGTYLNGLRIPEQSYVKLNHLDCLRFGYGSDVFYVRKSVEASTPKQTIESSSCLSQLDQSSKGATLLSKPFTDSWNSTNQNRETSTKFKRHSVGDTDINGCHVVTNRKYSTSDKLQDHQEKLQYTDSLEDLRTTPSSAQEQSSHSRLSPVFLISQKSQPQAKPSVMSPHGSRTNVKSAGDSSHPHSPESTTGEKTPTPSTQHTVGQESFSQKAESPCSEEKDDRTDSGIVSSPDKGVATSPVAFTIAFSNEFAAPRKTLGIKDSISKFAPPDRQRQRTKANDNTNGTKAVSQDAKSVSSSDTNRKQERLASEKSEYPEEKVKVKHKESPSKKQPTANGKLSTSATYLIQRMLDSEPSPKIVSEEETNQEVSPCSVERKGQFTSPQKHSSPKQDSKMQQKHLHSPTADKELYIGDDKSETGTYTVEGDQTDKDLEEARRKIDEVFGVFINHDSMSETQSAFSLVGDLTKIPDTVSEEMKKSAEYSHQEPSKEQTPSRPKRRLPTPPIQNFVQSVNTTRSGSPSRITPKPIPSPRPKHKGQSSLQQSWHGELPSGFCVQESSTGELVDNRLATSTNDLQFKPSPPDRSVKKGKKISSKRTVSPGRSNDIMTKSVDGALHNPADKRKSPRAKTGGILWKKMPWNLTSSEQDLDHSRSETASIVSDISTSTEPSSQSSGRGKTDSGPQMKLNRAFALRRARLGLDSDTPCGVSSANSRPPTGTTDVKNRATHLNPSLHRQDGGRFSLRLPRSSPRPGCAKLADSKKPALGRVSSPKSQQKSKKKQPSDYKGHKRNDSDPGKPRISARKTSFTVTVSDTEARSGTPNSQNSSFDGDNLQFFHRSASFSGADDLLAEHRPFRGIPISLSHRDFTGRSHLRSQSFRNSQLAKTKQGNYSKKEEFVDNGLKAETDQEKIQSGQQKRELSALDCLVVSAIYQLSAKLRSTARIILEKEKNRHPTNSDTRLMIDEVLPQITDKRLPDYALDINHANLTRELSSVLKNLKRVEQGIEVVATLMDSRCEDGSSKHKEQTASHSGFFIVDV